MERGEDGAGLGFHSEAGRRPGRRLPFRAMSSFFSGPTQTPAA
jgi:hypothetical protein